MLNRIWLWLKWWGYWRWLRPVHMIREGSVTLDKFAGPGVVSIGQENRFSIPSNFIKWLGPLDHIPQGKWCKCAPLGTICGCGIGVGGFFSKEWSGMIRGRKVIIDAAQIPWIEPY